MGRDEREGVVDAHGRVFGHPGLYIADGSVMPGPVGPNPSLTIAALADRFADALLEDMARPAIGATPPARAAGPEPAAAPPGDVALEFTEELRGFITFGEDDHDRAYRAGKRARTACALRVTVTVDDVERFLADPERTARAAGHVECDALGGRLAVTGGWFNVVAESDARRRISYRLALADGEGHPITLSGVKEIEDDPGLDVWSDVTTLFTRITAGHDGDGARIASGILHVRPQDLPGLVGSFRVRPPHRVDALARFGALSAGELWEVFG
jgi:cholesterol oxidase